MKKRYLTQGIAIVLLVGLLVPPGVRASPVQQTPTQPIFADPAFEKVWSRTDTPVADGSVKRSFYWGPKPLSGPLAEAYAEGANGKHLVQYFDKGRMEVNNPGADPANPFYVTPGRLTMELVTGQIQVGNDKYMTHYQANIPIAGDTDDPTTPTYASFLSIGPGVAQFAEDNTGKPVIGVATKDRGYGQNAGFAASGVRIAFFEPVTKRNVPNVFWDFLNARGPVIVNGRRVDARLSDPYFYVTGFPITDPWWVYAKVEGKRGVPVLVQLYERRVLTYVPDAPAGFKVQMGNIGQHYYDWRYKGGGQPDPVTGCTSPAPGSFGALWSSNTVVQNRLFCPMTLPKTIPMAMQHFEHGHMVYVDLTGAMEGLFAPKRVYVMFEDGTGTYFPDFYQGEPEPTPNPTPPPGLVAPVLGFGKVWRDQAQVRQKLGWALAGEKGIAKENYQFFTRGLMVRDAGKLFVVSIFDPNGIWSSFDDRYVP